MDHMDHELAPRSYDRKRRNRRFVGLGGVVLAAVAATFGPNDAHGAPSMHRGVDIVSYSMQECLRRAERTFQTEGYSIIWRGFDAFLGTKGMYSAIIMCDAGPADKVILNIVVASEIAGQNTNTYNEQIRLGQGMGRGDGSAPAPGAGTAPQPPGAAIPQLAGSYNTGYPNLASITQTGSKFSMNNGYGDVFEGVWEKGKIVVPSRNTLGPGELEAGNCVIQWRGNGATWRRVGAPCGPATAADLSVAGGRCDVPGTWFYMGDRKQRPSSIEGQGDAFRVDNGQGSVSRGRLQQGKLIADDWGVTGTFAENGCRINWSNNTWWRQYR